MRLNEYQLTPAEVEYLINIPAESEEALRVRSYLIYQQMERIRKLNKSRFKPTTWIPPETEKLPKLKIGRWNVLVWFAQQERIMEVDEMIAAIRRFGDEETFQMLKVTE